MSRDEAELLVVKELTLESTAGQRVVNDVSVRVARGEFLAVVGESGSGKTMLARALMRLLPPGIRCVGGRIVLEGEDLTGASAQRLRELRGRTVGMVFQEPMLSLNPAMKIGTQMVEGMRVHEKLSDHEIRRRSLAMLSRVRLNEPERVFDAYPHEFSGGMRQRIMLASVMLLQPRLLLADEPTTALDTLSQREVLDLMVSLALEQGTAVILITHNLGLVKRYADRAIVMRQGELVEEGVPSRLLADPQHSYTRALVDALPRRAPARALRRVNRPVVSVKNLSVVYSGRQKLFGRRHDQKAVEAVSLDVNPGEVVAVVGGSGSGKTTLGRAILGLVPASGDHVHIEGVDMLSVGRSARRAQRMRCQFIYQDPHSSLDPRMRVADIVGEPLRGEPGLAKAERERRVDEALDSVGLSGFGARFPHAISGGQRQRVAIARAIIRNPAFVVADEPVSALDMTIQKQVLELFRALQERYGFACLFISHDLAAVEQVADRVIVMDAGRFVEQGTCEELFQSPQHAYTKALLAATPLVDWGNRSELIAAV